MGSQGHLKKERNKLISAYRKVRYSRILNQNCKEMLHPLQIKSAEKF